MAVLCTSQPEQESFCFNMSTLSLFRSRGDKSLHNPQFEHQEFPFSLWGQGSCRITLSWSQPGSLVLGYSG